MNKCFAKHIHILCCHGSQITIECEHPSLCCYQLQPKKNSVKTEKTKSVDTWKFYCTLLPPLSLYSTRFLWDCSWHILWAWEPLRDWQCDKTRTEYCKMWTCCALLYQSGCDEVLSAICFIQHLNNKITAQKRCVPKRWHQTVLYLCCWSWYMIVIKKFFSQIFGNSRMQHKYLKVLATFC